MAERTILHSDLNSFYASVEMMLDPSLRGKAVAVCGATEDRHGIVLAKSDLAKKAGVKTGMVNWEAKQLCKDLVMVPPHYDQYLKYSKLTQSIYQRYTDLTKGVFVETEEVHHRKPLAEGGTHARDNLIALCKSCHSKIHAERGDRWHK